MWIRAIWADGFRSLREVKLADLGAFNVFYGENGAGKSNILAALELMVRIAGLRISCDGDIREPTHRDWVDSLVRDDDFCRSASAPRMSLGMTLIGSNNKPVFGSGAYSTATITFEVVIERLPGRGLCVHFSRLEGQGEQDDLLSLWDPRNNATDTRLNLIRWFEVVVATASYRLISAIREVHSERGELNAKNRPSLAALLEKGYIKEAFVLALTSPDPIVRKRFARLRELLEGEPLRRPPFDPVYDPQTQTYEIRERSGGSSVQDVPLDLAGLGIQQIYAVLGQILLGRAFAVGIEEPEAHLHAPTTGRHLRVLLQRLVELGDVQQLFIATHSNLFDLDPTGYYDVSLTESGNTVVQRKALSEIDRQHLYEPGPAKHGLADLLRLVEPETPVLRRPDGSPVTAVEMLALLQEDAPEAVEFLRDVHGAAVRAVQLRARRRS